MSHDSSGEEDVQDEDEYAGYYDHSEYDPDVIDVPEDRRDPEHFEFECLLVADVDRLLNESVETICSRISVTPSLAKVSSRPFDFY